MIRDFLISMRPKQWYKNFVVFIGIVFSHNLFNIDLWYSVLSGFVILCVLSGNSYVINDIIDRKNDSIHPKKKNRPIASGKLKVLYVLPVAIVTILFSCFWAYSLNMQFLYIVIAFFAMTLAYTFWLKNLVIIDVIAISVNFVLRAIAGVVIIGAAFSPWIILCALLLALLLAFGKRIHEMTLLGQEGKNHRKTLDVYPKEMLDHMISITAGALLVSYSIFTFFSKTVFMMATIPIVIYAVFRYFFLVYREKIGGEPELIFKDKGMIISITLWVVLSIIILYAL